MRLPPLLARLAGPFADQPAAIWALFFGNVVNYAGNFVWPLMTLLLTDRLGLPPSRASLYVSLAVAAYMPGTALGGKLADRYGRKKVVVVSRVVSAALLLPCALVPPSPLLVYLIILSRFSGAAADPAVAAMAADLAPGTRRTGAVSLLYLGLNVGFAIGPLIAGVLYRDHLAWVFLGDALTTLVSALVAAIWVPETLGAASRDAPEAERPVEGSLWAVLRDRPQLWPVALALLLLSLAYSQTTFGLPMQALHLLGPEAGPRAYGLAMGVNGLAVVVSTFLLARVTLPSLAQIALGGALYAVGFGAVGLVAGVPGLVATTVVWSIGEVMVANHWRVYVSDQSPSSHRARILGAMTLVVGSGFVAGPALAGPLVEAAGLSAVWQACFGVSAIGALLLAAWIARRARPEVSARTG